MDSRERNRWNRTFAESWRVLQQADPSPRKVMLNTDLTVAARKLRDQGNSAVQTARGLYMGTRDAREARRG